MRYFFFYNIKLLIITKEFEFISLEYYYINNYITYKITNVLSLNHFLSHEQ